LTQFRFMCKLTSALQKGLAPKMLNKTSFGLKLASNYSFFDDRKRKMCDTKADVTIHYQFRPHENRVRRIIDVDIILMMNRSIVGARE
jgi:hypothetical protein